MKNDHWSLSPRGTEFIAGFEGFVSRPYNDAAGNATIGYGHLLHYGQVTVYDRVRYAAGLSRKAALVLLRKDAEWASRCVRQHIVRPLQNQTTFDALVSFVFNVGCGGLTGTRVQRDIEGEKWGDLRYALIEWDHAGGAELPGLRRRREAEATLILTGSYGRP